MNYCVICHDPIATGPFTCEECDTTLKGIHSATYKDGFQCGDFKIHSLWSYEDPIRSLILRVKVDDDFRALQFFIDRFAKDPWVAALADGCDLIMPAPSSLWGRLRGRFDLAYMLADALSEKFDLSFQTAPFKFHWRIKKRAMNKSFAQSSLRTPSGISGVSSSRILMIDDVVTTGRTMSEVSESLSDADVVMLTLAEALQ